jgi:phospholipid transport system substrate-binding protein
MNTRRSVLIAGGLALTPLALGPAPFAATGSSPLDYIRTLGNRVLEVINGDASWEQKRAYLHLLLQQDFDIPGIAHFVLGPYWQSASEPERQEVIRLLDAYIMATFGRRLAEYGGISLRVTGSRGTLSDPLVASEIIRPGGGPPIKMDWMLSARSGVYKITDLVVDNVSMAASQRSEFAGTIQRTGGTVSGLIATMRQTIAAAGG